MSNNNNNNESADFSGERIASGQDDYRLPYAHSRSSRWFSWPAATDRRIRAHLHRRHDDISIPDSDGKAPLASRC